MQIWKCVEVAVFSWKPYLCFCCQHLWIMALGSVSLLNQDFRSLPAERKRLCGVKPSVSGVFSSDEPLCVRAALQSFFAYSWPWVPWGAGTARLGAQSLPLHRAGDSLSFCHLGTAQWFAPQTSSGLEVALPWKKNVPIHGKSYQWWTSVEAWRERKRKTGKQWSIRYTFNITSFSLGWVFSLIEMLKNLRLSWWHET